MRRVFLTGSVVLIAGIATGIISCRNFKNPSEQPEKTVTMQQGVNGYTGTRDAHIVSGYPDRNTGENEKLVAGSNSLLDERALLIQFDILTVPAAATVTEAYIELYFIEEDTLGSGNKVLHTYPITGSWVEGEGTGDIGEEAGETDWVTWVSQPTIILTALDQELIKNEPGTWFRFGVSEAAQDWVLDGFSNRGVLIKENSPDEEGTFRFASSEHLDPGLRPKLTVAYRE